MHLPTRSLLLAAVLLATALPASGPARAADTSGDVRLYALDCGRIEFDDMGMFADDDSYAGQPGALVEPCYLVRHPDGTLLWDTGLGDAIAARPGQVLEEEGVRFRVPVTLQSQLQALELAPTAIDYVALSHMHYDHTGNLARFPASTWLVDATELAWASQSPTPGPVTRAHFDGFAGKREVIEGDHDVFGDGRVRILRTPGHTPGHRVLLLELDNAGTVVLSGDLYHSRSNYERGRVPAFNVDRADTLASFDRVRQLLQVHDGRLVIQHAPEDFEALPAFPAYLD
ncbi:hypothetical protein N799_12175 [Lysobacter arseniciresistens ZS79]|uniref:Metallo-beta-lactamase domain-containing protein n=1 Tax=Lysobacter arseniciresistens ZS79 TaxID=913325 RepID=A0A0A0F3P5_9GAMM|nr:N-acyl homoserine lactonase family protein [Lysobacter arseniciresistens]KGM56958.1 hypothetical protein N799_12175 [Lysobacter arseniciresistens ZS79]